MESPGESTAVVKIRRDFHDTFSTSQRKRTSSHLSFNDEGCSRKSFSLTSERDSYRQEAEQAANKGYICELESKVKSLETDNKRAKIEHQLQIDNLKTNLTKDSSQYGELQAQLHQLARQEKDIRLKFKAARAEQDEMRASYEDKMASLRSDLVDSDAKLQEVESSLYDEISALREANEVLEEKLRKALNDKQDVEIQRVNTLRRMSDVNHQLQDLEEYRMKCLASDNRVKDLESELQKVEDDSVIVHAMKAKLDKMPEMELTIKKLTAENDHLKNKQENIYLLDEELRAAKDKIEALQRRNTKLAEMEANYEELEKKLQEWVSIADRCGLERSPALFGQHVMEIQKANMMLIERQGQLSTAVKKAANMQGVSERDLQTEKEKTLRLTQQNDQQDQLIKRLRRKLLLVSKERNGFKDILDSYENDTTCNMVQLRNDRIKELEAIMSDYQSHVTELEQANEQLTAQLFDNDTVLASHQPNRSSRQSIAKVLNFSVSEIDEQIVVDLRAQIASLHEELSKAKATSDTLENRLAHLNMQGIYDPTKTKVMHFVMNPFTVAKKKKAAQMQELKEDNERLLARVKILEENAGQEVEDLTLKVKENIEEEGPMKHQIEEMKTKLQSAELRNQRYMEIFKKKSHEFREICYQLLGFRIDIVTDGKYKMMNMYAENAEDFLLFQQTDGELQLLETDYSSSLADKIDTYLTRGHSIPAFLSSLTIDLYSSQTMIGQDSTMQ